MRLRSDHVQWYDGIFDGRGPTFHRVAYEPGGLAKREQLALFDRLGLSTPPHGIIRELARTRVPWGCDPALWQREVECVVYEDEHLHRGLGKHKMTLADAVALHPDRYASLFIASGARATSFRHVRFGRIGIWLRYVARPGEWRTNVDAEEEEVVGVARDLEPAPIPRVLWAIDFVPSVLGLLALDFNTAPELRALGESGLVRDDELHEELKRAAAERPEHLAQL